MIRAVVNCVQPAPDDTVCDAAAGTGGFLLAAHDYVVHHHVGELDKDQKKHLRTGFVHGVELVPNTARLCIMNRGADCSETPQFQIQRLKRQPTVA